MEMLDGSRRMIRDSEPGGMEENGCWRGGEEGSHRQNALIQSLRKKETRLRRMARFLAVAVLVLLSVAVALLITAEHGEAEQRADTQPTAQPHVHHLSAISVKQKQQDFKNPSAMLTAPRGNHTVGDFLAWESEIGRAFCRGGFSYSSGDLVVPKSGLYRVFLQITYESQKGFPCPSDGLKLSNAVFVFQEEYPINVKLMESVDRVICSMETWSKSLYTAGLFLLETNSRLRVQSSPADLIVKTEYQVFFGSELVSQ